MRVIFLDIDGVLNHEGTFVRAKQLHIEKRCASWSRESQTLSDGPQCTCYATENQMEPECIAHLNRIVERTGAKVVISSSWRRIIDAPEIARILRKHGFDGEVIGQTPDFANDHAWAEYHREQKLIGDAGDRGWEIWQWLYDNRDRVTGFVILDDCSDMARLKQCLVLTDDRVGLSNRGADLAISTLSRSHDFVSVIRSTPWRV